MQKLKGCLLLALLYSANSFSLLPVDVFLQCENGIHATLKDQKMSVEGLFNLPFEKIEEETDEHTMVVFADQNIQAKILIRHADARFFLQNSDGSWIPCKANRINL